MPSVACGFVRHLLPLHHLVLMRTFISKFLYICFDHICKKINFYENRPTPRREPGEDASENVGAFVVGWRRLVTVSLFQYRHLFDGCMLVTLQLVVKDASLGQCTPLNAKLIVPSFKGPFPEQDFLARRIKQA